MIKYRACFGDTINKRIVLGIAPMKGPNNGIILVIPIITLIRSVYGKPIICITIKHIRPIIKVLNDKGWKTILCCEGHWQECYNCYWGGFIGFREPLPIEYRPHIEGYDEKPADKYQSQMKRAYMYYVDHGFYFDGDRHKRTSKEEKWAEHQRLLNELLKWANNLPQKENNNEKYN